MKRQLCVIVLLHSILYAGYYEESEMQSLQEMQIKQRQEQSNATKELKEFQSQRAEAVTDQQEQESQAALDKATRKKLQTDVDLSTTSVEIQKRKIQQLLNSSSSPEQEDRIEKATKSLKTLEDKVNAAEIALKKLKIQADNIIDGSSGVISNKTSSVDYTAELTKTTFTDAISSFFGTNQQDQFLNNFSHAYSTIQAHTPSYEQQLIKFEALNAALEPLIVTHNQEMSAYKELLDQRIAQIKEFINFAPSEPSEPLLEHLEVTYKLSQKIPMDRNSILVELLTNNVSRDVVQQIMATASLYNEEELEYGLVAQELLKDDVKQAFVEQTLEVLTSFAEQTSEFIKKIDVLDETAPEDSSGLEEWFNTTPIGHYVADVSDAMVNKSYEWMSVANDNVQSISEYFINKGELLKNVEKYIDQADTINKSIATFVDDHSTALSVANNLVGTSVKIFTGRDIAQQASGINKAVNSIVDYLKPYAPAIGKAGDHIINLGNYLVQQSNTTMDWIGMEKDITQVQKSIDFMGRAKVESERLNSVEHREIFMEVVQARVKQQQEVFNSNKLTKYEQLKEYASQTIERVKSLLASSKPEIESSFTQLVQSRKDYIKYLKKFDQHLSIESSAEQIQNAITTAQSLHDVNLAKNTGKFLKDMQNYAEASSRYTLCSKIAENSVQKSIEVFNTLEISPQSSVLDMMNGIIDNRTLQRSHLQDLKYYTDVFAEQLKEVKGNDFSKLQNKATLNALTDLIQGAQANNIIETNRIIDGFSKQMNAYQRAVLEEHAQQLTAIN